MEELVEDILFPGSVFDVYYNEDNINNCRVHVRAIVDNDIVVVRRWSNRKGWMYKAEHAASFLVMYENGKLRNFKKEAV